ncbi:glycosyltransferase [Halapricum salinum]|uniref:Glycosyltransferase n=1 Tax=Halapricum salinum TaxID=1457250 RepID=A0A4D6HGR3_9EURY|nr:glycosyltransferase [Halapricum salinum]QCC52318.1 glycosyltransferase [Halapricum salinum]
MKVELFATGPDQDCGIATYTKTLEDALEIDYHRTPLRLRSCNVVHYIRQSVKAGTTDSDVIHVQHEYDIYGPKSIASWFVFPILWILSTLRRRPIVITFHSAWGEETVEPPLVGLKWTYLRLNNWMLARVADYAIFLSEDTRQTFEATTSLSSVEVIAHGVPTDIHPMSREQACNRLGLDPDTDIVAEPGFVRPQKGYHTFLDIAERVPEATFVVGGGTHEGEYEEYMAEIQSRCGEGVVVTGVLDDDEFHALFNAMDLAVLPYESVTQSGILNWCLAYEVPVLGTDVERFRELTAEYGFPAVFPIDDPDSGAERVRTVLEDPQPVLESMRDYRAAHGMDDIAATHAAVYQRLL